MPSNEVTRLGRWLDDVQKTWKAQAEAADDEPWTQKRFCEYIGITPNGLRGWIKGAHGTIHHSSRENIASKLGVTMDDIDAVMAGRDVRVPPRPDDGHDLDDQQLAALERRIDQWQTEVRDDIRRLQQQVTDLAVAVATRRPNGD